MLRWSLASDRRLFDAFWRMAAPDWELPAEDVAFCTEVDMSKGSAVGSGRIDLTLSVPNRYLLGVEVKTRETSTTSGQLERYRDGLADTYPECDLAIAYLTPFNSQWAGHDAPTLPSAREFRKFHEAFPAAVHMSWLDLAELEWNGGELWEQHRAYVPKEIASQKRLDQWRPGSRSRQLSDFFGPEAAAAFEERLRAEVGDLDGYVLDLARVPVPTPARGGLRNGVVLDLRADLLFVSFSEVTTILDCEQVTSHGEFTCPTRCIALFAPPSRDRSMAQPSSDAQSISCKRATRLFAQSKVEEMRGWTELESSPTVPSSS